MSEEYLHSEIQNRADIPIVAIMLSFFKLVPASDSAGKDFYDCFQLFVV